MVSVSSTMSTSYVFRLRYPACLYAVQAPQRQSRRRSCFITIGMPQTMTRRMITYGWMRTTTYAGRAHSRVRDTSRLAREFTRQMVFGNSGYGQPLAVCSMPTVSTDAFSDIRAVWLAPPSPAQGTPHQLQNIFAIPDFPDYSQEKISRSL